MHDSQRHIAVNSMLDKCSESSLKATPQEGLEFGRSDLNKQAVDDHKLLLDQSPSCSA